ncbi:hypothetical protein, conserved [Eimeria brunetti]|uniref:ISP3 C-terminal domain-containing protein n=1 Tax=Eimeria brunetti TaxID=51314 RepID=U6LPK1_9EIME|nr:hypothetical protein, conserved [Eimeria brunetti]
MGNSPCSICCGIEGEEESNITLQQQQQARAPAGLKKLTPQQYDSWLQRHAQGSGVEVLFPDGQRIQCKLTLDSGREILTLAFKDKVRSIPYKDVDCWIYGPSAVDQASADAQLLKDPKVVGFRLSTSGRAIAVAFEDTEGALCFVRFLEQILENRKEPADQTSAAAAAAAAAAKLTAASLCV